MSVSSPRSGVSLTAAAIRVDGLEIDANFGWSCCSRCLAWLVRVRRGRRRQGTCRSPASSCWPPWHSCRGAGIVGLLIGPMPGAAGPAAGANLQLRGCSRRWASSAVSPTWRPAANPADDRPEVGTLGRSCVHVGIPVLVARPRAPRGQPRPARGVVRLASRRADALPGGPAAGRRACLPRVRHHRLPHGRPVGAGRPGLGEVLPHPPAAARRPLGLRPVRRGGQGSRARAAGARRRPSRPRPPTSSATASGWPS